MHTLTHAKGAWFERSTPAQAAQYVAHMATRAADHRTVVAAVLLLVVAAAQPAAAAAGAGTGGADGGRRISRGAAPTTGRARAPLPPAVRVRCTGLHVVRPGETCASVARAAGLTAGQFMMLNPNLTCAAMFHGQWVCVRGSAIG